MERSHQFNSFRTTAYEALSDNRVLIGLTIVPTLFILLVINILPILWTVWASFFEIPTLSPDWTWIGIDNYVTTLQSEEFLPVVQRSVIFAVGSTSLQLVIGTGTAILINKSFRFNKFVRAVLMLPFFIPTAILGFLALWMGNSQFGVINRTLLNSGIISEPIAWFGDPSIAMVSLIFTNSWKFGIFVMIMVLARLQSIPEGYYEAAQLAGASRYQRFRDITLPNLKGVIFIVLLLRGVWMFNKFDIIWILTRGGPGDATTTSAIYAYRVAFSNFNLGEAAAVSTLLFVLLSAVAVIYFYVLEPEEEVRVE